MSVLKKYQEGRNVRKVISLLCLAITYCVLLTGCIQTQHVLNELQLPDPPELKMRDIKWDVYYIDNQTKMCLSPQYYSNLSLNMQDVQVFMVYQNKIIRIYKND